MTKGKTREHHETVIKESLGRESQERKGRPTERKLIPSPPPGKKMAKKVSEITGGAEWRRPPLFRKKKTSGSAGRSVKREKKKDTFTSGKNTVPSLMERTVAPACKKKSATKSDAEEKTGA